jgi:hypothetical protein
MWLWYACNGELREATCDWTLSPDSITSKVSDPGETQARGWV